MSKKLASDENERNQTNRKLNTGNEFLTRTRETRQTEN